MRRIGLLAPAVAALLVGGCSQEQMSSDHNASRPTPSVTSTPSPTATAAKSVAISFVKQKASPGCAKTCYWVNIDVTGFPKGSTQTNDMRFNGADYCGGSVGCSNPKSFSVGSDGRGGIHNYYYISSTLRGTVSAEVDGLADTKRVP